VAVVEVDGEHGPTPELVAARPDLVGVEAPRRVEMPAVLLGVPDDVVARRTACALR
jgi:hypothetical protein